MTVVDVASGDGKRVDSDTNGRWVVSGVATGKVRITVESPGFKSSVLNADYASYRPGWVPIGLQVAAATETVEVTASAQMMRLPPGVARDAIKDKKQEQQSAPASANVVNLQKRVAGVLPIAIDVPHAGTSFRFVRPLVVDEETKVTFSYKTK